MSDVVIDLGDLTDEAAHGAPAPRRRPASYRAFAVTVAALLAATLAGSVAPVAPTPVTTVPAAPSDIAFLGPDEYYVVGAADDPPNSPVQNKIIDVYDLPSAAPAVRTAVTVTGPVLHVLAAGGLVLISYQADGPGTIVTAAYTAGTEHTVWRRYGRLFGVTRSGRVALLADAPSGATTPRWRGVDLRTGQDRWRLDRREENADALAGIAERRLDTLIVVTPDGRIEARDVDTGRVTATASTPAPAAWRTSVPWVVLAGDLLLVGGGGPGTTAYTVTTLAERWRSTVDLSGWHADSDCGDVICLVGYSQGLRVVDRATGRQRWSADGWVAAERAGPRLLVTPPGADVGAQPMTVLDVADGAVRGTLGPWQPVGAATGGAVPVTRREPATQRVFYGWLDAATLAVRVVGVAEQVTGGCGSTAGVLVCRRADASAGVWPFLSP